MAAVNFLCVLCCVARAKIFKSLDYWNFQKSFHSMFVFFHLVNFHRPEIGTTNIRPWQLCSPFSIHSVRCTVHLVHLSVILQSIWIYICGTKMHLKSRVDVTDLRLWCCYTTHKHSVNLKREVFVFWYNWTNNNPMCLYVHLCHSLIKHIYLSIIGEMYLNVCNFLESFFTLRTFLPYICRKLRAKQDDHLCEGTPKCALGQVSRIGNIDSTHT